MFAVAPAMANDVSWPSRPIKLVVGFPPGGAADVVARSVGEQLSRELGQPVVIDNRAGAATTIASTFVARSEPDGYTLYIGSMNLHGLDKILYPSISYDGNRDFTPISRWVASPMIVVVGKDSPFKSLGDLAAAAKVKPDDINYASAGNGTTTHQAPVYFQQATGIKLFHVPYKGGSPAITAMLTGDTQVSFATPPTVLPHIKAGTLKALAVTSSERSPLFPEIPSAVESGVKGYDYRFWYGLYGPAKLPEAIVNKLFAASTKALADPKVKASLERQGMEVLPSSSVSEFRSLIAKDGPKTAEFGKLIGSLE
ncbi:tripartite-type tricarboxylate transporter receptor subunit TctC [Pseudorhodoferax soli]|uniref:Tripartite-type tricarboxylate transporter receptor subunit TctC n=2 Tax=Pseudorhodoferax soli TaxID=545864 RepID=A0A368XG08_9BURK|nr:tripartite-type tricarboxylate transporter receptor subunit TctC [Pseudorhodoferax soli]